MGDFPKLGVTLLGVLIPGIAVFGGLYWLGITSPIYGNSPYKTLTRILKVKFLKPKP